MDVSFKTVWVEFSSSEEENLAVGFCKIKGMPKPKEKTNSCRKILSV
jgi:hypothetical protein